MDDIVIKVENLSKQYNLGVIGHGTLYRDLQSKWARFRGKEDPNSKVDLHTAGSGSDLDECFWALRDVSFEVRRGEILGIIGRNGAGKSTLLKILSRVTGPTTGSVKIKGRVASLLEVGTGFHPELTGRENVFLNGSILGMTRCEIESRFDEIVRFAEIEKFIDTPVKRYSSGMYVRLAFSVAAHLEPDILILDEVLSVGDAAFQKKCLGKMQNIVDMGRTILFVSHSMPSLESICSRVIWIDKGGIIRDGNTKEIIVEYINDCNTTFFKRKVGEYENLGPRRGTGQIQFTHIRLLNSDGIKAVTFYPGEPIWMEVGFEVFHDIEDAHFGYGIFDGVTKVKISRWRESKPTKKYFTGEKGTFSLIIPNNPLKPRNYYFLLVINGANPDQAYDVWEGSGTEFSILYRTEGLTQESEIHVDGGLIDIDGITEVKIS